MELQLFERIVHVGRERLLPDGVDGLGDGFRLEQLLLALEAPHIRVAGPCEDEISAVQTQVELGKNHAGMCKNSLWYIKRA